MSLKYIDIHAHVNFPQFDADRAEVILRAHKSGVSYINIGTNRATSEQVIRLAEQYPGVFACVGIHPIHAGDSEYNHEEFLAMAKHPQVVAIGECGLDFFHITEQADTFKKKQTEVFEKQIELALEVDKPVMIHCRDAYDETLEILKKWQEKSGGKLRGNFHFFAGDTDTLKEVLDLGFTVSFTGVITFAPQYRELVERVPLDRIHAETDCPYVAPVPFRGKRNEPLYVIETVRKMAEIKGLSIEKMAEQLVENAERFFKVTL